MSDRELTYNEAINLLKIMHIQVRGGYHISKWDYDNFNKAILKVVTEFNKINVKEVS